MRKPTADTLVETLLAGDSARSQRVREAIAYLDDETWRKLYETSKSVTAFTATKRVDSEAFDPATRKLCDRGDTIKVLMWECFKGPTRVSIKSRERAREYTTSIPFSWIVEMGAPDNLAQYMPPIGYTWEDVMSAIGSGTK